MARKEILDRIQKYVDPFRITKGKGFRLKDFDPADTCGLKLDKGEAADLLQSGTAWLAEEQDILYAQDRWSLLLVGGCARPASFLPNEKGKSDFARGPRHRGPP